MWTYQERAAAGAAEPSQPVTALAFKPAAVAVPATATAAVAVMPT